MGGLRCSCTAGRTTSTVSPTWRRSSPQQGFRVIVPYLRGFGTTRFLSDETVRNGQQSVVAVDALALMDALELEQAVVAGFDWGARTADILAALWPERCTGLVSVSGYLIGNQAAGRQPLPPAAELQWWYQYYFATERGRAGYDANRRDFAKLIWHTASPQWEFDDATFDRSAAAFDNPDHVDDRDPQLPLATRARRGRSAVRRARSSGSPRARPSRFRPSRSRATPTAHPTPTRAPTRRSSRAVRAPHDRRRHRAQPSAGGAGSVRGGRRWTSPADEGVPVTDPSIPCPPAVRGSPRAVRRRDRLAQLAAAHAGGAARQGRARRLLDLHLHQLAAHPRLRSCLGRASTREQGLVVIGVHTPEFPFEGELDNVRWAREGDADRLSRRGRHRLRRLERVRQPLLAGDLPRRCAGQDPLPPFRRRRIRGRRAGHPATAPRSGR